MQALKVLLIIAALIIFTAAAGIVTCTAQLVHGASDMAEQSTADVKAAVAATQSTMVVEAGAIRLQAVVTPNGDGTYQAAIGIGIPLAKALGITLEYQPSPTAENGWKKGPNGAIEYHWQPGAYGYSSGFGHPEHVTLAGSGGKTIDRTPHSVYEGASSTSNKEGIEITLAYDQLPPQDEFLIAGKLVKLQFPAR